MVQPEIGAVFDGSGTSNGDGVFLARNFRRTVETVSEKQYKFWIYPVIL